MENVKCLVFIDFKKNINKIIKFKNRDMAKEYYRVANKKNNLKFVGLENDCIDWCKSQSIEFEVIEREKYNLYE